MLAEMTDILGRLVVYPDRMRANIDLTGGAIFSQPVLLALVDAGMDRYEAYRLVQGHALRSWDGGPPLLEALRHEPRVVELLGEERLVALFDPAPQLDHVDAIFGRLGIENGEGGTAGRAPSEQHIP
jgi:adenylosuccinate lyase